MSSIVAVILTYNEAAHIADCIASVRFADEVVVFDSYSTDDTVAIARDCGAVVLQNPFENYAQQRNAALKAMEDRADWLLFVDADERISPELAAEIREASAQSGYDGWRIPRHNYIFGKLTRGAGWYPDYQTRLLRLGAAHYDPRRKVHEIILLDGGDSRLGTLENPIIHYNYTDGAQFATKQRKYTAYEAKIMHEQGIRPRPQNYILQPLRHFRWRFFTLKGYRDGLHGLRLSLWLAWYEFRKYQILRGMWKR